MKNPVNNSVKLLNQTKKMPYFITIEVAATKIWENMKNQFKTLNKHLNMIHLIQLHFQIQESFIEKWKSLNKLLNISLNKLIRIKKILNLQKVMHIEHIVILDQVCITKQSKITQWLLNQTLKTYNIYIIEEFAIKEFINIIKQLQILLRKLIYLNVLLLISFGDTVMIQWENLNQQ